MPNSLNIRNIGIYNIIASGVLSVIVQTKSGSVHEPDRFILKNYLLLLPHPQR